MTSQFTPPFVRRLVQAIWTSSAALSMIPLSPGFFSIQHKGATWWLEDPAKHSFWSMGVDCVGTGDAGKPGNPNYDGLKLFGTDDAWANDTANKFKSWGINTLGGWSETDKFHGSLPYVEVLHLGSYDKAPWHDLFSPESQAIIAKAAADLVPKYRNDPNLIGYFSDNELGWWDDTLFLTYFGFAKTAPGKMECVKTIKGFYQNDFKRFSKDWITPARSFDDLLTETKIHLKPGTSGIQVVHAFNYALARQYYKFVYRLIRQYDPNHLILGDRYCQYYNIATAEASKDFVDVESTNAGADWTDGSYTHSYFESLHAMTGKPVIITEFYFSAKENQSGNRNSGSAFPLVATQAERAKGFEGSLKSLARLPFVVGAHWFQFTDEPPKGRGDGEDWNFGLEDIKGNPYPLMLDVFKRFKPVKIHATEAAMVRNRIPVTPAKPMQDNLLRWNRDRGLVTSHSKDQWADLYVSHDKDNLYVGLVPMEYGDPSLYETGKMPEEDRPELKLQVGSWHGSVRYGFSSPAKATGGISKIAERPGLKHMLTLQIPLKSLDTPRLIAGHQVHLSAQLSSHGRGYSMSWDQNLTIE